MNGIESKRTKRIRVYSRVLNTWRIPNDTREPIDLLQTEEDIKLFMKEYFHEELPFHTIEELKVFEKISG